MLVNLSAFAANLINEMDKYFDYRTQPKNKHVTYFIETFI